ncbi:hypothetical protein AB0I81_38800 [Nonomuraea sp. NPDC050404]|uniref:hypothetical protein n=1 Tax=Nonomuraea sp. NPDC050404 TaxID=3155783 RepID=UPI0033E8CA0A
MDSQFKFIQHARDARRQLSELLALVIALSFAVNLLSSAVFDLWGITGALVSGIAIIALCAAYFYFTRSRGRKYFLEIGATFAVSAEDRAKIIRMPGYAFGKSFANIAHAVFEENEALKSQWVNGDFVTYEHIKGISWKSAPGPGVRLAREIAEYIVIHMLGTHLTDYFANSELDRSRVHNYERKELPHVLLSNRVLDLISRDVEDRPGFGPAEQGGWRLVYGGPGKRLYSHFRLSLPKGSSVTREASGDLLIDSPAILLRISTDFQGYGAAVPFDYCRYLLKSDPLSVKNYQVKFTISAEVKDAIFRRRSLWAYYGWVESFIEKIRNDVDYAEFFRRTNWEASELIIEAIEQMRKANNDKEEKEAT